MRIICRRLDPRDIGLPILQIRFFVHHPYAHDLGDLGWASGQQMRLMAHQRDMLPLPMLEIDLKDWVPDFAGTLARPRAFLDLPDDPACVRFDEQTRRVRTASARQVRQPINARGLCRWRNDNEQLRPILTELGLSGPLKERPTVANP